MSRTLALTGDLSSALGSMIGPIGPRLSLRRMVDLPEPPGPRSEGDGSAESSFELLLRAKSGESDAVERLCQRYLPRLRRWAHGRLPGSSRGMLDTEDLA